MGIEGVAVYSSEQNGDSEGEESGQKPSLPVASKDRGNDVRLLPAS